jgi:RNA polymerase sigma factor (sigma-70 family)
VDFEEIERTGRLAAAGDRAELDRLLVGVRPLILGRCRKFLPNPLDAEEAAQDALLSIARRIESFEGRSKFTTWMYQLTTNAAIDCYRKLKRRRSVLETPPELAAGGSSPSVIAGARIDLLEAAEQIDERLVEPVFMRDLCELEYADIAELLDVPVGTIKSRIHDGRAKLRHALYGAQAGETGRTSHRRQQPGSLES